LRQAAVALLIAFLVSPAGSAEPERGSVCVAPIPKEPPRTAATPDLFCSSGKLSLKIDSLQAVPWPNQKSLKIGDLDLNSAHRVVVLCDGKPQQSFKFRFSEFKTGRMCLFINDLYQTAQLWEPRRAPWCKCK